MHAIGSVESCFPNRCGTPRQGLLVEAAKGRIVLGKLIPEESLEALEQFSHMWVIFLFHKNTNVGSGKGFVPGRTFPAKACS